jgi:hypothetical protein
MNTTGTRTGQHNANYYLFYMPADNMRVFKENVNVIIIFQMLFFSARDDNVERIELALKNGADVNWPMESNVNPGNVRTILRIDIFNISNVILIAFYLN